MEKKKIDIVVMFFETLILEDKIIHIGQIWESMTQAWIWEISLAPVSIHPPCCPVLALWADLSETRDAACYIKQ